MRFPPFILSHGHLSLLCQLAITLTTLADLLQSLRARGSFGVGTCFAVGDAVVFGRVCGRERVRVARRLERIVGLRLGLEACGET